MFLQDRHQYNILFSCTGEAKAGFEPYVHEHTLACMLAGEFHVHMATGVQVFRKGDVCLIPRHQLVRGIKKPGNEGAFMAVNVFLNQPILKKYSILHDRHATGLYLGDSIITLPSDALLNGYFSSLLPYYEQPDRLSEALAQLKTLEAIELLLRDSRLNNVLFNFEEPFKIDLEEYMNRHFMHNVSMSQFAHLTGRSLATFKRDFKKVFALSPEKWLQKKRLQQAHHLISQRQLRPSEVFMEVGFETFAHFSTAFKHEFGYTPSSLLTPT